MLCKVQTFILVFQNNLTSKPPFFPISVKTALQGQVSLVRRELPDSTGATNSSVTSILLNAVVKTSGENNGLGVLMSDTCTAIFNTLSFNFVCTNGSSTPNLVFSISSKGVGLNTGDSVYFKAQTSDSNELSVNFDAVSAKSGGNCSSSDKNTIRCVWDQGVASHVIEGQGQASGAGLTCDEDGQVVTDFNSYKAALIGYYSASGAACQYHIQCLPGFFLDKNDSNCKPCGPGSYSDAKDSSSTSGSTSCTLCAAGTSSDAGSSSSSSCVACPMGTFSPQDGSLCVSCPAGSYSSAIGSTSCASCPSGQSSSEDFTACI